MLDEISQMIEMIYSNRESAMHLCRKLYRFFVYYDLTEGLDNDVIESMADTFIANDYKLQPVIEDLLRSEHFYEAALGLDDDKFGGIIKSPMDLVVGTVNFLNIPVPNYTMETEKYYDFAGGLLRNMSLMGMNLYEPYEVAGYSAYHQYPIFNRNWISTNYLTQRYDFIRQQFVSQGEIAGYDPLMFFQVNFGATVGNARDLVLALAPYLLSQTDNLDFNSGINDSVGITGQRLRYFLQAFLGFTDYDMEVDAAVNGWALLYDNPANYLEVSTRLTSLLNAMMQSPEYQLY